MELLAQPRRVLAANMGTQNPNPNLAEDLRTVDPTMMAIMTMIEDK